LNPLADYSFTLENHLTSDAAKKWSSGLEDKLVIGSTMTVRNIVTAVKERHNANSLGAVAVAYGLMSESARKQFADIYNGV
jgi:hypothetical protein